MNSFAQSVTGGLVLAATPIGNAGDASARLIELLGTADVIAAEDTRRLRDLARRLGVTIAGRSFPITTTTNALAWANCWTKWQGGRSSLLSRMPECQQFPIPVTLLLSRPANADCP